MRKLILIAAALFASIPTGALANSCTTQLRSSTTVEDHALNEMQAGDAAGSFLDSQRAVIYRQDCADQTTGLAKKWNQYFVAFDFFAMYVTSRETETWKDEADGYLRKSAEVSDKLLTENLPDELRRLAGSLGNHREQPPTDPSTPGLR